MNKEIHKIPSAKLQRMQIESVEFQLEHAPGKTIVLADYLSRYTNENEEVKEDKILTESELSINVTDEHIQKETEKDNELKKVKEYCCIGWPTNKAKCLDDNILFYRERIIVPKSMRQHILKKLHVPHFGVNKTLKRAQTSVFWPCISNDIEQMISRCKKC